MRYLVQLATLLGGLVFGALPANAEEGLSIGVQATGTVKWELAAMAALGLDAGLALEIRDVADSRAGQIALQAGEVDVILSDFVWVSVQRQQGAAFTMVPHSLTVGGLMVEPNAGIAALADLRGKTIAVSGSPVDKSFVILSAAYGKSTGRSLAEDATLRFGAPPLVNEVLASGQAQAALNLWNWNARAKVAGKIEFTSIAALLGELGVAGVPPLLGWTFFEPSGEAQAMALTGFLDASFATKAVLLSDDAIWETIRPVMNVGEDDALFTRLRDDYRAGIVTRYADEDIELARQSFAVMAQFGGSEVVGPADERAEGTFWRGYRK